MKKTLSRLFNHETLTRHEASELMRLLATGSCSEAQMAALLAVYNMRSATVEEILGFCDALRESQTRVDLRAYDPIDIVGTGGDGKNTFNISTCACFVVAGAGFHVAKHGNYGASGISGASNVLEQHGVHFSHSQDQLLRSIESCGVAYMHAPLFTPALRHVAAARKGLQLRSFFNLLGPLLNPCYPQHQLLGVADLTQMRLYTNLFQERGIAFAVVNNLDGYDEISLTSDFKITTDRYESIYTPQELGFTLATNRDLYGGDTPQQAAAIFDAVLENRATRPQIECVLINASFAIQTLCPGSSIADCVAQARESLESGRALAAFRKYLDINAA